MKGATRRVALATCRDLAELDLDSVQLVSALKKAGIAAEAVIWDDPSAAWPTFDLVVLRSTWDYPRKIHSFLRWIDGLPKVLNPAPVVRWNADKRYLGDLAAAGLPVVPTTFARPGHEFQFPPGPFVVKPAVGAGCKNTARYEMGQEELARQHIYRLNQSGTTAMIQPYLKDVEQVGETGLVFIGGRYSHAFRKGPMLGGDPRKENSLYFEEDIQQRQASSQEQSLAEQVLRAVPGGLDRLAYGRVDLLPTADGSVVLEVELIEPSLFLDFAPGSAERLARLIFDASARREGPL
jgi:glutathione synthase/RimK-type ligase-like ATP-grasp enzyme